MSIGDFLFGETEKLKQEDVRAPWQVALHKQLGETAETGALSRLQRAGEAYPGQLTAGFGEYEQWGMKGLGDYLKSPLASESELFQAGKGELLSTLEGDEYDPFKGEYYKAYRANMMRELRDAKDRIAAKTSARDKFYGGGRIATEGRMEEAGMGDLMQFLGSLQEAERARKLGAVGPATQMSMFEELGPLGRVETALSPQFGGLPRMLEQSDYERQYGEWVRQLADLGLPLDVAIKLSLYQPKTEYPLYSSTQGLFGGREGVSAQPSSWLDRSVLGTQTGLAAAMGGAGGGGIGGAMGGAMSGAGGSPQLTALLQSLFGGGSSAGTTPYAGMSGGSMMTPSFGYGGY